MNKRKWISGVAATLVVSFIVLGFWHEIRGRIERDRTQRDILSVLQDIGKAANLGAQTPQDKAQDAHLLMYAEHLLKGRIVVPKVALPPHSPSAYVPPPGPHDSLATNASLRIAHLLGCTEPDALRWALAVGDQAGVPVETTLRSLPIFLHLMQGCGAVTDEEHAFAAGLFIATAHWADREGVALPEAMVDALTCTWNINHARLGPGGELVFGEPMPPFDRLFILGEVKRPKR